MYGWLLVGQMAVDDGAKAGEGPMPMAGGNPPGDGGGGPGGILSFFTNPIALLGVMFVLMYFMLIRPQQQRQSEQAEMLKGLKVNDKVYTNGGILGTITSVSKEDQEVELRIDEKNNTKIRVLRSCIAGIDDDKSREVDE